MFPHLKSHLSGQPLAGIVLAAGRGKRMNSSIPKVLHLLDHKTILDHVTDNLKSIGITDICVVLGNDVAQFAEFLGRHPDVNVCIQSQPTGTGSAVGSATACFSGMAPLPYAPPHLYRGTPLKSEAVLICAGDVPGLDRATLQQFIEFCMERQAPLGILGMNVPDPRGYGRLLVAPDGERLEGIVEDRDATPSQKEIHLCNTGILYAQVPYLFSLLSSITNANQQGEYYLTDCVSVASQRGTKPFVYITSQWEQFAGINTAEQLQAVRNYMQGKK